MADRSRSVSILINAKNEASAALEKVGLSLGTVAAAAAAAGAALAVVAKIASDAVKAASEQEQADVRLAAALASVGQNSAATREDLAQFIDSLEDATKVSDETISSVVALLVQFGRLSGESLKRATAATLDYAAATGQDAASAATALVNIIVKGQGRLAGINTKFEEGSTAGQRLASVLSQMEKSAGGAAAALGDTFRGHVSQISTEWERFLENLGETIIKNPEVIAAIDSVAMAIKTLAKTVEENKEGLANLATLIVNAGSAAATTSVNIAGLTGQVVGLAAAGAKRFTEAFQELINFIKQLSTIGPVGMQFAGAFDTAGKTGEKTAPKLRDVGAGLKNVGEGTKEVLSPLAELNRLLEKLGADTLPQMQEQTKAVFDAGDELQRLFEAGVIDAEQFDAILQSIFDIAEKLPTIKEDFSAIFEVNRANASAAADLGDEIQEAIGERGTQAVLDFGDAWVDAISGARVSWTQFVKQVVADMIKIALRSALLNILTGGAFGASRGVGSLEGVGGGVPAGGGTIAAQHGGEVRGGMRGLDSVAALLQPGEIILPARLRGDFDAIADLAHEIRVSRPGGASAGMPAAAPPVSLALAFMGRDREREVADLITDITDAVERRGYRLVASEVRA